MLLYALLHTLTEYLPISSSLHLLLLDHYLNNTPSSSLNACFHLVTGLVTAIFFLTKPSYLNLQVFLRLALITLVLGVVGYYVHTLGGNLQLPLNSMLLINFFCGAVLLIVSYLPAEEQLANLSWFRVSIMAFAQVFALIPGVSRLGIILSIAKILQLSSRKFLPYAIMLSIPPSLGAGLLELKKVPLTLDLATMSGLLLMIVLAIIILNFICRRAKPNKDYRAAETSRTPGAAGASGINTFDTFAPLVTRHLCQDAYFGDGFLRFCGLYRMLLSVGLKICNII